MSGRRISVYAGCIAAMVLGPFAGVQPARATSTAEIILVGQGTSSAMGYPCVSAPCDPGTLPTMKADPKGMPWVNGHAGGGAGTFTIVAPCTDTKTAVVKPKVPLTAGPCAVLIGGTIRGFCNYFFMEGSFQYISSNGTQYGLTFKSIPLAGLHAVSGGNDRTHIHGLLQIHHGPGCTTSSSTQLTVVGQVVLKDLTP